MRQIKEIRAGDEIRARVFVGRFGHEHFEVYGWVDLPRGSKLSLGVRRFASMRVAVSYAVSTAREYGEPRLA